MAGGWQMPAPRRTPLLVAAALVMAWTAPAAAQDSQDPLRFLRPSVQGEAPPEAPSAAETFEPAAPVPVLELPPEIFVDPPGTALPLDDPLRQPLPANPALTEGEATEPPQEPAADFQDPVSAAEPARAPAAEPPTPAAASPAKPDSEPAATAAEPAPLQSAAVPDADRPLRLAVLAGRDVMSTMAATEPLAQGLRQVLGRPVEILPMSSFGAMIDAQATQRIDGGFYSAAAYAAAEAACGCLEPLVAPAAADGTAAYHSIVVARADSGIKAPGDLAGKVVALGAADSIGSRRMPLAGLMAEGIDPQLFRGVREVASAEEAVRLVAAGAADAAFAWSSLAGDAADGYSRGTLADLVRRGEISVADLAVIWRSPPVAHGPFAVLKGMPEADKRGIETYLLGLDATAPAAYDKVDPYYGGGFVAVEPGDYGGLAVLTAQNVDALRLPAAPAMSAEMPPAE
jgi:phosphonate transport system substrate-binding protein